MREQSAYRALSGITLLLSAGIIQGCASLSSANGHSGPYVGAGVGIAQLEPEVADNAAYTVDDKQDTSGHVTLGYDVTERISVEAEITELGRAKLSPQGKVDYQAASISGLYYAWKADDHADPRRGLSAYGRLGVATLENEARDINYRQAHETQAVIGAGIEYGFANNVALRGEVVSYDKDAMRAGLSIIYRFEGGNHTPSTAKASKAQQRQPLPVLAVKPLDAPAATPSSPPEKVTSQPVAVPQQWPTVYFSYNAALLSATARHKLDQVTQTLRTHPRLNIVLEGHTDNIGSEPFNLQLSLQRAAAAKQYLINKGIEKHRLRVSAQGSKHPVNKNQTPSQRALNRRVEIARQK